MKEVAYQFIHLQVQNGESCRFWSDNWSPYGKLHDYLDAGRSQLGIPKNATLASLQRNGSWQLPAARTKRQLQVLSYITTVQFNEEPDYYEWEISGEISNKYSTGDIYHFMRGTVEEAEWTKAIWTPGSITRQSFHAWYLPYALSVTRLMKPEIICFGIVVTCTLSGPKGQADVGSPQLEDGKTR
ncbi:uncharacterized protein LOC125580028 [Brassica napus]|uniref:uncharacterized protein LOC125580028 n=1 Tax=Brassica napus TaxID=3708 RepID=UPI0020786419|nr:uncharacterized protein LOC125580028 [Brassica napus]